MRFTLYIIIPGSNQEYETFQLGRLPYSTLPPDSLQPSGEELEQQQAKRSSPRDGSDKPWSVREEFQAKRKAAKVKYKDLPEHYRGYEMLMDTYEDPSMPIPAGAVIDITKL